MPIAEDIPRALYVHVPWCVKKCPYCDFNSHALKATLPETAYVNALLADLEAEAAPLQPRPVDSVFIGGGTPSLLSPPAVARLLDGIGARLPLTPACEVTLEANPGTVEAGRFEAFREAGITRLSIGVQSFDDARLKAIGRIHGGREARAAVEMAARAGFSSFNLDLMYGLPGQDRAGALEDLETAVDFGPDHLSWYQLTLEPNTLFHRQPPELPDEDAVWRMAGEGVERLEQRGYRRYEVSAFAQSGHECRHNLNYWRFGDYLGIGAGAHGKLSDPARGIVRRSLKKRHPRAYLEAAKSADFDHKREAVGSAGLPLEFMMNALRLVQGLPAGLFPERTGLSFEAVEAQVEAARSRGLMRVSGDVIAPTATGLRFLDELVLTFAPDQEAAAIPVAAPSPGGAPGEGLI